MDKQHKQRERMSAVNLKCASNQLTLTFVGVAIVDFQIHRLIYDTVAYRDIPNEKTPNYKALSCQDESDTTLKSKIWSYK